MPCCRYSGQWSAYLATMIWASSPGAAIPRAMGRDGAGCCTIREQWPQESLGRTCRMTLKYPGTMSNISEKSSPSWRIALPQSGQLQLDGACTIVSRGRWAGNARGARRKGSTRFCGGACVESSAGTVSSAATAGGALGKSSNASCNCASVASSRSDDRPNCQRFNRAISANNLAIKASRLASKSLSASMSSGSGVGVIVTLLNIGYESRLCEEQLRDQGHELFRAFTPHVVVAMFLLAGASRCLRAT